MVGLYQSIDSAAISRSESKGETTGAAANHREYRVQGIPEQYDYTTVKKFLGSLLKLDDNLTDIEINSLTRDPRLQNEKIATFRSSQVSAIIGSGDRRAITLPYTGQETLIMRKSHITLDTIFQFPEEGNYSFE